MHNSHMFFFSIYLCFQQLSLPPTCKASFLVKQIQVEQVDSGAICNQEPCSYEAYISLEEM